LTHVELFISIWNFRFLLDFLKLMSIKNLKIYYKVPHKFLFAEISSMKKREEKPEPAGSPLSSLAEPIILPGGSRVHAEPTCGPILPLVAYLRYIICFLPTANATPPPHTTTNRAISTPQTYTPTNGATYIFPVISYQLSHYR